MKNFIELVFMIFAMLPILGAIFAVYNICKASKSKPVNAFQGFYSKIEEKEDEKK